MNFHSPVLIREREIRKNLFYFRDENEKVIFFAQASRREREI